MLVDPFSLRDNIVAMRVRLLVTAAVLLIFTSFASGHDKSTVEFPGLGSVSVHTVRAKGEVPYVDLLTPTGKKLLRVEPETDKFWVVQDVSDATGPHIYYGVLHPAGLPEPLLLVVVRYVFASDCGYTPVLVGAQNGNLQVLTPKLERFLTRGGAYLEAASNGRPAQLTIVTERYQEKDVHSDGPSKMAVYRYDFDANAGKFVLVNREEVPTNKVKSKGENLLLAIPEIATC